jgi:hypothetical protein
VSIIEAGGRAEVEFAEELVEGVSELGFDILGLFELTDLCDEFVNDPDKLVLVTRACLVKSKNPFL